MPRFGSDFTAYDAVPISSADTGTGTPAEAAVGPTETETGTSTETSSFAQTVISPVTGVYEYGGFPTGYFPYGGGSLASASAPTVTMVAPVGVLGTGPKVLVEWNYSQAQGRPQSSALVQIFDTAKSNALVYSASVTGPAGSVTFDAIAAGLDANSGSAGRYTAEVTVYAGDPHLTATAQSSFDLGWGQPTVTVVAPVSGGPLYAPQTEIDWTYVDSLGVAEASFHIEVYDASGKLVASTGVTLGAATKALLYFFPNDGAGYTVTVTATNTNGVSGSGSVLVVGNNPTALGEADRAAELSPVTLRWYERLPAYMRDADAQQNPPNPLLGYMALIGEQAGAVEKLYDRLDYVPPSQGGPPADSGLPHSTSDLVDPYTADDTWLAWLGNVLGVQRQDRSLAQWRVAMTPRPDPSGAYALSTDPVTGDTKRVPLILSPYAAGSKGGIKQAVQDLYATAVQPATLIEDIAVINAGYAAQRAVAPALGASWASADGSALIGSLLNGFTFTSQSATQMTVESATTDPNTLSEFVVGSQYTFQMRLAGPVPEQCSLTVSLVGDTTATATATLNDSLDGTLLAVTVTAPNGVTSATATLVVADPTGGLNGQVVTATDIQTLAPIFNESMIGGAIFGLGIPEGATVIDVLGPVSIVMSEPAQFTVPAGLIVIVPPVPVLVTDHWLGDPWVVGVAVPFGTDPNALNNTLTAQQPAGVEFNVTFGVLTWHTLYTTYGDGSEASWTQTEGPGPTTFRTWNDLERQIT